MKLLYIAGPFTIAPGPEKNTEYAAAFALAAWRRGWATICPHKNSIRFEEERDIPAAVWYDGYLAILRKCDAVLLIPGWQKSPGAVAEKAEAERCGIRVFEYDAVGIPSPEEAIR